MAPSDLNLEAQIRRFWEIHFFVTPNNFANGPHFFALTQLRATKTGSTIFCIPRSYRFSECVRIPWLLAPKNLPVEDFRVRSNSRKSSIVHLFLCLPEKNFGDLLRPQFRCHRPSQ